MGYKGFIRSVGSTVRAIERENRRMQREYERQRKELAKLEAQEQAKFEVEEFENYIDVIQSMHKECNSPVDWEKVLNTKEPSRPIKEIKNEEAAVQKREQYAPSFFDKLFGFDKMKIINLNNNIEKAKEQDHKIFTENKKRYEENYNEWSNAKEIATHILQGNTDKYLEVIKEMSPFQEIENIGSSMVSQVINQDLILCDLDVFEDKVVPKERKSLLASGKLSVKQMPVVKFNEIYQDYVCSAVLRMAREIFALLPVNKVIVNANSKILNTQTGNLENTPILSVLMPRETIENINFEMIDPSDCMKNFVCNMDFKKSSGLSPVDKLDHTKYI